MLAWGSALDGVAATALPSPNHQDSPARRKSNRSRPPGRHRGGRGWNDDTLLDNSRQPVIQVRDGPPATRQTLSGSRIQHSIEESMLKRIAWVVMAACVAFTLVPASALSAEKKKSAKPANSKLIERGRYLSIIGGCNDCHTPGYLVSEGKVPQAQWLLGGDLGWRGPWGTTYAPNLRLTVSAMSEAQWIPYIRELRRRPTMPWFNVNQMTDGDLKALFAFIKTLSPVGPPATAYLAPDQEPKPPYFQLMAPPPPKQ
jgi:mono/diheme cytochrome c family protein